MFAKDTDLIGLDLVFISTTLTCVDPDILVTDAVTPKEITQSVIFESKKIELSESHTTIKLL